MYRFLENIKCPKDIKNLDYKELELLSLEVRDFLLKSVSETGGHLSSNLGVVELSIALHRVFNSPEDKIVFDVGHQGYVHKILTGRKNEFSTLRQYGGMSGFLKRTESEHDHFDAGHSSTSISVAAGFVKGRSFNKNNNSVVAVIGDGAMTGGMAYEALNNLGNSKEPVIVILNDNEMSISENVGGLSEYLGRLRTAQNYSVAKDITKTVLSKIPKIGGAIISGARRAKDSVKYLLVPGMFFEDIGFTYIGPIDGHNIKKIEESLEHCKNLKEPVLLHVITQKGKGYKKAEENPNLYHGVGAFDINNGVKEKVTNNYSDAFGKSLLKLAEKDKRIYAITAAMPDGTGLNCFRKKYPDRFVDVGIAEQHAVTMSAGMALSGIIPVFAVYSTFLQRAYDQILHDVCLQNLHVIFAIDRAGVVGQDGETHHGVFDIAYLKHIPNMTILAPSDGTELEKMLESAIYDIKGPVAIRYPRGSSEALKKYYELLSPYRNLENKVFEPEVIYETSKKYKNKLTIIALGNMIEKALGAVEALEEKEYMIKIINPKMATPNKLEELNSLITNDKNILTLEDGGVLGGFGEMVSLANKDKNVLNLGFPREFIPAGTQDELFEAYELDSKGIVSKIEKFFEKKKGLLEALNGR
ncbi:MAG: 1-deoxy-D-xylulose-5-phosphate synthase [Filifactoraceae bacterium]